MPKNTSTKDKLEIFPTIAITGCGYKGMTILKWLEEDPRFGKVLFLNYKKPNIKLKKTKFYKIDLTETLADLALSKIFKKEKVHTVVHTALPITPPHNVSRAHELISVGSMYVTNAATDAKVKKIILASTVDVYGAFANNPNYLTEEHPARAGQKSKFLRDKIDAEKYFLNFGKKNPNSVATILRSATILGPTIKSYKTRYFSLPFVHTVFGYDPLVQFTHEDDLMQAFRLVIEQDHPGIYNIASSGVIPLSKAIQLMGKINIPLLFLGLKSFVQMMWYLNISPAPSSHIDYLKYLCVAAIDKAENKMGFKPKYSCVDALMDFVGAERLRQVNLHTQKEVME